nr:helix-turn-helix domain-containing protein [Bradyrhizobium cytisi]
MKRSRTFLLGWRERLFSLKGSSNTVPRPMSRQDIADYLGLTIETVSRTFTKLDGMERSRSSMAESACAIPHGSRPWLRPEFCPACGHRPGRFAPFGSAAVPLRLAVSATLHSLKRIRAPSG